MAKRIGKNPNVLPKDESDYGLIGCYFKVILFTLFIYMVLFAGFPGIVFPAFIIHILDVDFVKYIGIFLMSIAFIWVAIAKVQMRNSWRIGIDHTTKTEIVTY